MEGQKMMAKKGCSVLNSTILISGTMMRFVLPVKLVNGCFVQSRGSLSDIYYSIGFPLSLMLIGGNGPKRVKCYKDDFLISSLNQDVPF